FACVKRQPTGRPPGERGTGRSPQHEPCISRITSDDICSRWLLFMGTLRQTRCWMVLPMARSQPQTVRVGPFVTVGDRAEMARVGELDVMGWRRSAVAASSFCIGAPLIMTRAMVEISMVKSPLTH